jgi:hypothetical protein
MLTAVYNLLVADTTLMSSLTGGIYRTQEISRQAAAAAYDTNLELLPCALLKGSTATPWGPQLHSGRLYFQLYLYQRSGYASIEPARLRIYKLLHRTRLTPSNGDGCYEIDHAGDVLDQEDATLGAALQLSRFVATIQRK